MATVKNYLSLIKFSHTIFAMPFALIGFFLAANQRVLIWYTNLFRDYLPAPWEVDNGTGQKPLHLVFLLVILCMVLARAAAMAFNRYLDRHFDALNPRTAIREIPKGVITAQNALAFTIVCSILFVLCTWFINPLCFFLSPVALAIVLGYSYTK